MSLQQHLVLLHSHFQSTARFFFAFENVACGSSDKCDAFSASEEVIDITVFSTPEGWSNTRNLFPNIKNRR